MTRIKHTGLPVLAAAVITGLIGYIIGSTQPTAPSNAAEADKKAASAQVPPPGSCW